MSRQYNPAVSMYYNMDIENMPKEKQTSSTGLLSKSKPMAAAGMDYKNPAVRVAKQLELIRNRRKEINAPE